MRTSGSGHSCRLRFEVPGTSLPEMMQDLQIGSTSEDVFARARARLTLNVPEGLTDPAIIPKHGDHDVDPVMREIAAVRPIRPAAVLVPIVAHAEPTVLLTQRTAHLPEHAGQVSFPGGKIDAGDA